MAYKPFVGMFRPFAGVFRPQRYREIDTFKAPKGEPSLLVPILVPIIILVPINKWSGTRSFLQNWTIEAGASGNFVNHKLWAETT